MSQIEELTNSKSTKTESVKNETAKNDSPVTVVGIDVANSTMKIFTENGKSLTYRNTLKKINDAGFVFSFNKEYKMYEYNNDTYEVGDLNVTGSGGRGQQRYATDDYKIELLIALAQVCNPSKSEKFKVVIGVPSNLAKNAEVLEKLKKMLKGTHELKIKSEKAPKKVSFEIVEVEVVAQPFGTLYDFMVNEKGEYTHPELISKNVMVIDIGWATLDLAILEQGRVRSTFGFEIGVADYVAAIQERVNTDIPDAKIYSLNTHQLDCALLESNVVETPFGKYDLTKYVQEQRVIEARKIYQKVMSLGQKYSDLYKIILTGGGALLYADELKAILDDPRVIIKDNAQISNVKGFYLFGKTN